MSGALSVVEASMTNDVRQLNLISHNLANVSTAGFKRSLAVTEPFGPYLVSASGGLDRGTIGALMVPQGRLMVQAMDPQPGVFTYTGNPLDIAIEGDGFFEVSSPQGTVYTRNGALRLDGNGRLVTAKGLVVQGVNGEIRLTGSSPSIDRQGRIWEGDQAIGQLRLVKFANPQTLTALGEGRYQGTDSGASEVAEAEVRLRQGYIEASNVNMMDEMVRLISTMRHFEFNQKVLKGYDEMLETVIRTIGEF